MGVLLVFLVFWRRGRYIVPDQQGDNRNSKLKTQYMAKYLAKVRAEKEIECSHHIQRQPPIDMIFRYHKNLGAVCKISHPNRGERFVPKTKQSTSPGLPELLVDRPQYSVAEYRNPQDSNSRPCNTPDRPHPP